MAETKNNIWEQAGKAGLVLGGISIVYMLLTMLVFISTYHKELRKEKERRAEETQSYGGFPKR